MRNVVAALQHRSSSALEDLSMPVTACGVLIPLVKIDGEFWILMTKRSQKLRGFPGEIVFPGGQVEQKDHWLANEAAKREGFEEIGLRSEDYFFLNCNLKPCIVRRHSKHNPDRFYCVSPSLAYIRSAETITKLRARCNPDEVESIHLLPMRALLDAVEDFKKHGDNPVIQLTNRDGMDHFEFKVKDRDGQEVMLRKITAKCMLDVLLKLHDRLSIPSLVFEPPRFSSTEFHRN